MKFVATTLSNIGSTLLNGYVFSVLWAWFIAATFGLPALTIAQAIGVTLIATYLTHQLPVHTKQAAEEIDISLVHFWNWTKPVLCLVVGWIIHKFM